MKYRYVSWVVRMTVERIIDAYGFVWDTFWWRLWWLRIQYVIKLQASIIRSWNSYDFRCCSHCSVILEWSTFLDETSKFLIVKPISVIWVANVIGSGLGVWRMKVGNIFEKYMNRTAWRISLSNSNPERVTNLDVSWILSRYRRLANGPRWSVKGLINVYTNQNVRRNYSLMDVHIRPCVYERGGLCVLCT
jgi:hypothetical protein